jgi:hypothetical protein
MTPAWVARAVSVICPVRAQRARWRALGAVTLSVGVAGGADLSFSTPGPLKVAVAGVGGLNAGGSGPWQSSPQTGGGAVGGKPPSTRTE